MVESLQERTDMVLADAELAAGTTRTLDDVIASIDDDDDGTLGMPREYGEE